MVSERSGVVNIGLEGMMLAGAFFACLGADKFGSWEMGLVTAAVAGAGFALVHAFFAIHLRADQIVGGTAINFLALGVTGYFFIQIYGDNGTPGDLPRIPDVTILGFVQDVTSSATSFGQLNLMIWLSFVLLDRRVGRPLPHAVRPAPARGRRAPARGGDGRHLASTRSATSRSSSRACSLRSAARTSRSASSDSFNENMTDGRGFIALAAVIFGNWRPFGAFARRGALRRLDGARRSGSRRTPTRRRSSSGAAVRPDAHRGRRRDRPLVPPASVGRPYTKQ